MTIRIPLFCLMVPTDIYFMNGMDSGRFMQQIQSVKWLPIAWSSTFQLGVFFAIWMSPRGIVTASIHFEITGFREQFLTALHRHRAESTEF